MSKPRICIGCGNPSDTGSLYCTACQAKTSESIESRKGTNILKDFEKAARSQSIYDKEKKESVAGETPPEKDESPKKTGPKKILIIDDEPNIVMVLKSRFEANHYEVRTAVNGVDGFEKIQAEKPDLIVLDILMEKMTGYELVQKLKAEVPESTQIPIIIMTAKPGMKDFFEAWDYHRFFPKPFDSAELMAAVRELLGEPA
ncbi:MAG TPA: response regulator [Candidatus Omnitrophota bacterium]|nr:response regulator [Candidatus Omnitrophota bacterium]